jgi:uncharacterized phage protein (TIGR01671 family)
MREIKFRALKDDMSNCTFQYGQLVYDANRVPRITNDGLLFTTCIKGTEGQFTGLKDKNGKEIYEGDVVTSTFSSKPNLICYGEFHDDVGDNDLSTQIGFYWHEEHYKTPFGKSINGNMDYCEVIGNIHDNPELLNQI